MLLSRFFAAIFSVGLMVGAGVVYGQDYPSKPIRIVTAGGRRRQRFHGAHDRARNFGSLGPAGDRGQSTAGVLAAETVSKAPPDGYTLLVTAVPHVDLTRCCKRRLTMRCGIFRRSR